jgi:hypothetical protein
VAETRPFLVMPVDPDMSAEEIGRTFGDIAAAVPGFFGPSDVAAAISKNGSAVLHVPDDAVDTLKDMLGDRFIFEPNARLHY